MEKTKLFINKIFSGKWNPLFIIVAIGFLLYGRTLSFGFTYLDDNVLILGNQYFLANVFNVFQSFFSEVFHIFGNSAFYYRPILTISFIFDYQFSLINPFMYHFTNVALHILASYLLFVFLTKLNYKKPISLVFSLIFLVHPVLTQAVAWIPGRNDSLLAVFVLSAFIFLIKYLKNEKSNNLIWALVFFGIALFTKESAVFAMPIMLFYVYFVYRKNKVIPIKNWLYFFVGSVCLIIFWAIMRHFVLNNPGSMTIIDMFESIYLNFPAVIQFLGKIFFPFNLSVLPVIQDTIFAYGIVATLLLAFIILITKSKRINFISFGFLWFFAFLLPSFIRPNPNLIADFIEHRLYVPIIGIFIVLLETDFIKNIDVKKRSTLIVIGILLLVFGGITFIHSKSFINRTVFWENAAKNSPHYPLAHRNLGAMKYLDGDMATAEKESKKALELNPEEAMAHNNLGLIYARQDKPKEAEMEYKKELEINPNYDDAFYNLGLLYWKEKRYDEAVDSWKKTLEVNPNHLDAFSALYNRK